MCVSHTTKKTTCRSHFSFQNEWDVKVKLRLLDEAPGAISPALVSLDRFTKDIVLKICY